MGPEFNLSTWCDTWLKSSGSNILEPLVEINPDGTLKSLKLKQLCSLRGQNRLRKQKLNIAIFEKAFVKGDSPFVIENIVISESDEVTDIDISKLPSDFVFGAVNVNHEDHAYAKTRFDTHSIEWFTQNLHQITHTLTRASIWRHFWLLVVDKKMKSVDFMNFVLK
jgi:aminopeptidase N